MLELYNHGVEPRVSELITSDPVKIEPEKPARLDFNTIRYLLLFVEPPDDANNLDIRKAA
jgi:hypothetical protein